MQTESFFRFHLNKAILDDKLISDEQEIILDVVISSIYITVELIFLNQNLVTNQEGEE